MNVIAFSPESVFVYWPLYFCQRHNMCLIMEKKMQKTAQEKKGSEASGLNTLPLPRCI